MTGMSTLCIHGDIQSGKHYHGAAHNLPYSTNPSPGINPNTLQSIIDVEYVRFVGCNLCLLNEAATRQKPLNLSPKR